VLLNEKSFWCLGTIGAGCGVEMKLGMEMQTSASAGIRIAMTQYIDRTWIEEVFGDQWR
jgi:hypothetical protein